MDTFDYLSTASLVTEVVADTLSSLTCDCHNCVGQTAVSYCLECSVRMCDTHQQAHSTLLGDKHEVIPISTYEMSPGTYKRVLCKQHGGEPIMEICERCGLSACLRCDQSAEPCAAKYEAEEEGGGGEEEEEGEEEEGGGKKRENEEDAKSTAHILKPLTKLKKEITAHFNRLLQSASNKLTEVCKLDKHIWKLLDDEEVECKKRIETIERICDEQIEVMREESKKLKEQIYEYQKTLTEQVELYNTELMDKKEKLEESRTKVHKWLRESHVTEKFQQKQQMTDELRNNTDIELECEPTTATLIIYPCKNRSLNINLVTTPTSITVKSEQPTNSQCVSASYKEDGDLLLGCVDGVRLLKLDNMEMINYETDDNSVSAVMVHGRNAFILHRADTARILEMCLPDVKQRDELFSFTYPGDKASFATVNDCYVVAVNPSNHTLVLYEFLTKQTTILRPKRHPWDVHFLPDGDLLVTTTPTKGLTRYRIENGELIEVWTSEGLKGVQTVCTDADGLIYVSTTNSNKTLYIISPCGMKLNEIKDTQLPDIAGQISIRGRDELAVPSSKDKSVCLFEINCCVDVRYRTI